MYEELLAGARLPTLHNRCQQDTATLMYRSFSCDVTELISAMLVHISVMCFSKKYMQTESKVIILLSSQSKIMASEEKKILRLILTMFFQFHSLIMLKSWMGKSKVLHEEKLDDWNQSCLDRGKTL